MMLVWHSVPTVINPSKPVHVPRKLPQSSKIAALRFIFTFTYLSSNVKRFACINDRKQSACNGRIITVVAMLISAKDAAD